MKKLEKLVKTRKPMSFESRQVLYGVSILLTFLAAGRLGALA